jgi:hypothetical protein
MATKEEDADACCTVYHQIQRGKHLGVPGYWVVHKGAGDPQVKT